MKLQEVRVLGPDGKLKFCFSQQVLIKKLYADCSGLATDVNMRGRKSKFKRKARPVRYLQCHHCGCKISTTVRMPKYYCCTACGDRYREGVRKGGKVYVRNSLKEIPWPVIAKGKTASGAAQDCASKRGESKLIQRQGKYHP